MKFQGITFNLNEYFLSENMSNLNKDDLAYLRNAIYAKYGYPFENEKYSSFFSKYEWYSEIDHCFKEFLFDGQGKIYYCSIDSPDGSNYKCCYDYKTNRSYEIKNDRLIKKLEKFRKN